VKDSGVKMVASFIAAAVSALSVVWVGHNIGLEWAIGLTAFYASYHVMRAQDKGNA
jgi:UPF0716 family protein affecting phage T7 exclusion